MLSYVGANRKPNHAPKAIKGTKALKVTLALKDRFPFNSFSIFSRFCVGK